MATDLGDRLAAARENRGWSLPDAADRSGVPPGHLGDIETGHVRHPSVTTLIRVAVAYELPLADLIALAGHADFGALDDDGHLTDYTDRELWHVVAYLPKGREAEVCEWLTTHGIEVYRMDQAARPR